MEDGRGWRRCAENRHPGHHSTAKGKLLKARHVPTGTSDEYGRTARQRAVDAKHCLLKGRSPTVLPGPTSSLLQPINRQLGLMQQHEVDKGAVEPLPRRFPCGAIIGCDAQASGGWREGGLAPLYLRATPKSGVEPQRLSEAVGVLPLLQQRRCRRRQRTSAWDQ